MIRLSLHTALHMLCDVPVSASQRKRLLTGPPCTPARCAPHDMRCTCPACAGLPAHTHDIAREAAAIARDIAAPPGGEALPRIGPPVAWKTLHAASPGGCNRAPVGVCRTAKPGKAPAHWTVGLPEVCRCWVPGGCCCAPVTAAPPMRGACIPRRSQGCTPLASRTILRSRCLQGNALQVSNCRKFGQSRRGRQICGQEHDGIQLPASDTPCPDRLRAVADDAQHDLPTSLHCSTQSSCTCGQWPHACLQWLHVGLHCRGRSACNLHLKQPWFVHGSCGTAALLFGLPDLCSGQLAQRSWRGPGIPPRGHTGAATGTGCLAHCIGGGAPDEA